METFIRPRLPRRLRIASLTDQIGLSRLYLSVRAQPWWPWPTLTVVMYHRINHVDALGGLDPDLIDATPEVFEAHMRFFKASFSCVTPDDVVGCLESGRALPPNPLMVTFDDGYLDNHDHALPILKRTGMRATFFVSTAFMQRRKLFWWDRIFMTISQAKVDRIVLSYPHEIVFDVATEAGRAEAIKQANKIVKATFGMDPDRFMDELARAARVDWSPATEQALAERSLMSWDQVKALHDAGMSVQSHTRTHRVISNLSEPELSSEFAGAREELEERLKNEVHTIAYPVGRSIVGKAHIRKALTAAGYKLGFTANAGENRLDGDIDPYDLKRLTIDRCFTSSVVRGLAVLPWLAP